jgi:TMEM175 potassium channel family protein
MSKGRMEAFSDGMIGIFITIMVLELKVPHGQDWHALKPLAPEFLSYVLSFIFLGIYWNNHHHLLHAAERINGKVLWANLHLLFWLSLVPITTGWMGEHPGDSVPVAVYGIDMLCAAVAYTILFRTLLSAQGEGSKLAVAIGKDAKGNLSLLCYALAIPLAFLRPWIAIALYVLVASMWLVPDRRIEKQVA